MKSSQRHLNGIKSIFGGLKNWWSGEDKKKEEEVPKPERKPAAKLQSALDEAPDSTRDRGEHPALRLQSETSGFYEDDTDFGGPTKPQGGAYGGRSGFQEQKEVQSGFKHYDEQLDRNLGKVSRKSYI